jgi:hypothetical protein
MDQQDETAPGGSANDGTVNGGGSANDEAVASRSVLPGCRFALGAILILVAMLMLCGVLWRRVHQVDPLQRCAVAYKSSYTAVDTTLVDRIKVRTPDGQGRTTCGRLREEGRVNHVPEQERRRPFE